MTVATRIVGFGNPLGGDDGFGPAVLTALAGQFLPAGVELAQAPPVAWDALELFSGCRQAIVVDVVTDGRSPGSLDWFEPEGLVDDGRRGQHAFGLGGLLGLLPACLPAPLPKIRILGAEPLLIATATPRLSPALADAVPLAVARIRAALDQP